MRVILYTEDFNEKINEPVDVILSPQYYWIKKIDIPIKSLKDAKKIAKSMFKLNDNYLYDAFELNGSFYAYAIDKNLNLNIDKKFINSIRLAQTELYNYDSFNVSKNHSIQKIEDLLFCFPKADNAIDINEILPTLQLSKYKVNLFDRINIDKPLLIHIFIIFLLINISLLTNYINNKKAISKIEQEKTTLIQKKHLPKTTFQLNSIILNLQKIDTEQNRLRKNLEFITKTPLKNNEKFQKLAFNKNTFSIEIKTDKSFDKYFSKKFKVVSTLKDPIYKAFLNQ